MIKKFLAFFIVFICCIPLFAQSVAENQNRIVYNRFEYFFNTQQTDSIYALATENFRKQVMPHDFATLLQYYYQFGNIKEAVPVTFNKGIAGYNLIFPTKKVYLQIGIDSTYRYHTFAIHDQPYQLETVKEIQSNVTKKTDLDFYVDSIARTYLTNPATASLSIGTVHNNVVNTFFYGETIKSDKTSLPTANSIYEIGSISKVFTAVLLADLVEKNIISLDDSIAKFLPDSVKVNPLIQKITFKQLANHTSGLPRLPDNFEKTARYTENNPYEGYTRKELFHFLKEAKQTTEPGEEYAYSNLGYGLLGELISIITKKTYSQNIKETITTPLGMISTVERIDPKTQKIGAVYNEKGEQVPTWDFQALAGAGALKSTVGDLLRFAQYQFKMPENALENALALTRQFTYYLPPSTDIGLAWNMNLSNDVIYYWHNGGTAGSSAFIAIVPDLKSAVVVLSNAGHSVDDISLKILNKVLTSK